LINISMVLGHYRQNKAKGENRKFHKLLLHRFRATDVALYGDPDFRMRLGNPMMREDVLVRHPRLRIYIAHGGCPNLSETIALMLMYRQVYMDISGIDWLLTREEFHYYFKGLMQTRPGNGSYLVRIR
jgi:hypothetical protein